MTIKYSDYQTTADISVTAIYTALIIAVNTVLKAVVGLDIGIFLILICTIFFKTRISFLVAISSSLIAFFINADIFYSIAAFTSTMLFWALCVGFKLILYRYFIITYITMIAFMALRYVILYSLWFVVYDYQTGLSLYVMNTFEMHYVLIGYMILPIFITKRVYNLFKGINNINETYFNEKIKSEIRSESKMKNFSDEKKHYNLQLSSLIISMMIMVAYICYVPYLAANWFTNYNFAAIIFITPLIMTFVTPMWLKRKKRIGNKKQLETNWIGIFFGVICTLIPTCFNLADYSRILQIHLIILFAIGIVLFSIFIAGAIPMNIEMIKSYNLRNGRKEKIKSIMGWTCFLLMPFPFIFYALDLSYLTVILLGVATFVVMLLVMINKNILDKPNVLEVDRDNFKVLRRDRKYMLTMFLQSYFYGISKFFEFGAVLLLFIPIYKTGFVLDTKVWTFGLMICAIYLVKFVTQAIFRTIKVTDKNSVLVNITSSGLILTGILLLLAFWVTAEAQNSLFTNMNFTLWSYFIVLILASALVSSGATIMDKSKSGVYQRLVGPKYFGEAMLLDHVAGNALFNLLINLIFLAVILAVPTSNSSMLVFWACSLGVTGLALVTNAILQIPKESKLREVKTEVI